MTYSIWSTPDCTGTAYQTVSGTDGACLTIPNQSGTLRINCAESPAGTRPVRHFFSDSACSTNLVDSYEYVGINPVGTCTTVFSNSVLLYCDSQRCIEHLFNDAACAGGNPTLTNLPFESDAFPYACVPFYTADDNEMRPAGATPLYVKVTPPSSLLPSCPRGRLPWTV